VREQFAARREGPAEWVTVNESKNRTFQWVIKTILEWCLAFLLMLLTLPLQLLIALAIRLDSAGPALFIQERLGRGGKVFRMYKFRTLRWVLTSTPVLNPDGSTRIERDDARMTRIGRWLRIGFDEMPQLLNVVKGEMALIGPRPDEPFHRKFYTDIEEKKLTVLPGITGLPQASGRNEIPWKERISLDIKYIDNYSLWNDVIIIFSTFRALTRKRGVYAANSKRSADD
jgi:undecaprenyl phosphate N,N'-diacetylbacillosamine 1-phosphate transferase